MNWSCGVVSDVNDGASFSRGKLKDGWADFGLVTSADFHHVMKSLTIQAREGFLWILVYIIADKVKILLFFYLFLCMH